MTIHPISVLVFDGFFSRARGLLGRTQLLKTHGALISPCKAVHTLGMDAVIDVVFVDRAMSVVSCVERLRPNRLARADNQNAYATLELASGEISRRGICQGDLIDLHVSKENRNAPRQS